MKVKSIKDIKDLKGKRALVRVDYNLSFQDGKLDFKDDLRIRASLETIKYLLDKGAAVILMAHLGRPEGWDKKLTLAPIAKYLAKLLHKKVDFISEDIRKPIFKKSPLTPLFQSGGLKQKRGEKKVPPFVKGRAGGIFMLENIRFYPEESRGDLDFAKRLADLGDMYINEGFSVSHRADASVAGLQNFLPSYAGIFLEREIVNLSKCLRVRWRGRPYVALMGGAKISTKINLILRLLKSANNVLLGGALISGLLKFQGYKIGKTLTEDIDPKVAKNILKNRKIVMPRDVVVAKANNIKNIRTVRLSDTKELCKKDESILDMGPETVLEFSKYIKKAQTIVWNGPLGLFEKPAFAYATISLAQLIAARGKGKAFAAVGGGETVAALELSKMGEYVDWISTGGGAMLSFLAGELMPGLKGIVR